MSDAKPERLSDPPMPKNPRSLGRALLNLDDRKRAAAKGMTLEEYRQDVRRQMMERRKG